MKRRGPVTDRSEVDRLLRLTEHSAIAAIGLWSLVALLWIAVVILTLAGCAAPSTSPGTPSSASSSASSSPGSTEVRPKDPHADKGWSITDIQATTQYSVTAISGRVTNGAETSRTGLLTLTVFGPGGARIADCTAGVVDVAPHDTVTAQFVCSPQNVPGDPASFSYELKGTL